MLCVVVYWCVFRFVVYCFVTCLVCFVLRCVCVVLIRFCCVCVCVVLRIVCGACVVSVDPIMLVWHIVVQFVVVFVSL